MNTRAIRTKVSKRDSEDSLAYSNPLISIKRERNPNWRHRVFKPVMHLPRSLLPELRSSLKHNNLQPHSVAPDSHKSKCRLKWTQRRLVEWGSKNSCWKIERQIAKESDRSRTMLFRDGIGHLRSSSLRSCMIRPSICGPSAASSQTCSCAASLLWIRTMTSDRDVCSAATVASLWVQRMATPSRSAPKIR